MKERERENERKREREKDLFEQLSEHPQSS